jgi:hypothetical protein
VRFDCGWWSDDHRPRSDYHRRGHNNDTANCGYGSADHASMYRGPADHDAGLGCDDCRYDATVTSDDTRADDDASDRSRDHARASVNGR